MSTDTQAPAPPNFLFQAASRVTPYNGARNAPVIQKYVRQIRDSFIGNWADERRIISMTVTGGAATWFDMLRDNDRFLLMDGEEILQQLRIAFYPVNYADAAHGTLLRFQQGKRTLGEFLLEFVRLHRELPPNTVNEASLRVILIRGVNEPYHAEVMRLNTTNFREVFDYLQRVANTYSLNASLAPDAMEIDNLETRAASGPPLNDVPEAELAALNAKLMSQMTCFHCHKPGHMIKDCKIRRQERSREAAEKRKKEGR